MILVILGLAIWVGVHLLKRVAPDQRAAMQDKMGDGSKGVIAVALVIAIVLMVIGYRGSDGSILWGRSAATTGINNLLMLIAVALFGLGNSKSRLRKAMRHPMLLAVVVWAVAHILVNGDAVSLVLFGGLALWALLEIVVINRAEPGYVPFDGGSVAGDVRLGVITFVVFAVIAGIHALLGYPVFGG